MLGLALHTYNEKESMNLLVALDEGNEVALHRRNQALILGARTVSRTGAVSFRTAGGDQQNNLTFLFGSKV